MSNIPAMEGNSAKPDDSARGCLVGCLIIAALGIIAVFPWARNLPTYTIEFPNHYYVDIPATIARFLPPGYPAEIAFTPPRYVEMPPNLQGILVSLFVTSLACVFFMILYALRNTVPLFVRLGIFIVEMALLIWVLAAIVRWLLTPSVESLPF